MIPDKISIYDIEVKMPIVIQTMKAGDDMKFSQIALELNIYVHLFRYNTV